MYNITKCSEILPTSGYLRNDTEKIEGSIKISGRKIRVYTMLRKNSIMDVSTIQ